MDPQLVKQLRETISIATASGVDAAGDASFNAPSTLSARVVNITETSELGRLAGSDGTIPKSAIAIITQTEIPMNARVWLPGLSSADATLARNPHYVEKAIDEFGNLDFYRTIV